ncbi:hypothetical protein DRH29_05085 [candidate division Kazan bacterium]|uniref:Uncharacterized protein n=1 Tax=candidate division Kazan bacterium TaxID=2202143 RepID=A0A420ZBF3_UNCK3|nr:MAG: hypothetical protein DRH29_05085 [candidate division Kazan bacterium]
MKLRKIRPSLRTGQANVVGPHCGVVQMNRVVLVTEKLVGQMKRQYRGHSHDSATRAGGRSMQKPFEIYLLSL